MDDLKLFAREKNELQQELAIVKIFSDNIRTEMGLEKYATAVCKHGKITKTRNVSLNNRRAIRNLELDQTYKDVDIASSNGIDNSQMKDKLL
jgi:hypothetical protein